MQFVKKTGRRVRLQFSQPARVADGVGIVIALMSQHLAYLWRPVEREATYPQPKRKCHASGLNQALLTCTSTMYTSMHNTTHQVPATWQQHAVPATVSQHFARIVNHVAIVQPGCDSCTRDCDFHSHGGCSWFSQMPNCRHNLTLQFRRTPRMQSRLFGWKATPSVAGQISIPGLAFLLTNNTSLLSALAQFVRTHPANCSPLSIAPWNLTEKKGIAVVKLNVIVCNCNAVSKMQLTEEFEQSS